MQKWFLMLGCFSLLSVSALSGCDDSNSSEDGYVSARSAMTKKSKTCHFSNVVSSCSADKTMITDITCDTETHENIECPVGTQCEVITEFGVQSAFCVPTPIECLIDTCDPATGHLKRCVNGQYQDVDCGEDKLCKAWDENNALFAVCEKRLEPNLKEEEKEIDPCELSGHGKATSMECSTDKKSSYLICSDGYQFAEACGPFQCGEFNFISVVPPMFQNSPIAAFFPKDITFKFCGADLFANTLKALFSQIPSDDF